MAGTLQVLHSAAPLSHVLLIPLVALILIKREPLSIVPHPRLAPACRHPAGEKSKQNPSAPYAKQIAIAQIK
jgi:hypothetical protein